MYSPNSSFTKKLKQIDKDLYAEWNSRMELWEIKIKSYRGGDIVLRVQNQDGSFRPLDQRTLDWLNYNRYNRSINFVRERLEMFRKQDEQKERESKRKIRELAEEGADIFSSFDLEDKDKSFMRSLY